MRNLIARASVIVASTEIGPAAANPLLASGLYQVEVRIALPNVQAAAAPVVLTEQKNFPSAAGDAAMSAASRMAPEARR